MKFTKNTVKGFTLIELLVVIAIIGLLSTIITGPIQNGLKKGRDAKRIGDVMAMKNALAQYATDNGGVFPANLDGLISGGYLKTSDLVNATSTTSTKDKIVYATYSMSGVISSYHLGVPLEAQNPALSSDADCLVTAGTGNAGCSSITGATTTVSNLGSGSTIAATGSTVPTLTQDFGGNGESTTVCTLTSGVSTCMFDIIP